MKYAILYRWPGIRAKELGMFKDDLWKFHRVPGHYDSVMMFRTKKAAEDQVAAFPGKADFEYKVVKVGIWLEYPEATEGI